MLQPERKSRSVAEEGIEIQSYVDGEGPTFVLLPSYGRDGGADFDDLTGRLVHEGWKVLRPQPRGVAGSRGPMVGLTLHDLANDVARSIRRLGRGAAVVLGHALGNGVARMLAVDHPDLVKALILASAQASRVPKDIARAPFIAGDPAVPEDERLAVLHKAFFAPGHDARIWLEGWYPETLKMQKAAVEAVAPSDYWSGGTAPILQLIPEHDPFIPKTYWHELREQLGERVTTKVIEDASHALFPEQPRQVADRTLSWAMRHRDD